MKFCSNCGEKLEDKVDFCPQCGAKQDMAVNKNGGNTDREAVSADSSVVADPERTIYIPAPAANAESVNRKDTAEGGMPENGAASQKMIYGNEKAFCPSCGAENEQGTAFCAFCGSPMIVGGIAPEKKKFPVIAVAAAAAAVVVVGGIAFFGVRTWSGGRGGNNVLIYCKEDEVDLWNGKNSEKLTGRYDIENDGDFTAKYSRDGRYLYFIDEQEGGAGTLRMRDLKKNSSKDDATVKIASDVDSFCFVNHNVIITKSDQSMYRAAVGSEETSKIMSDVETWEWNNSILYLCSDEKIYQYDLSKKDADKEKLVSNVWLFDNVSSDGKILYYTDTDGELCCFRDGEKTRISDEGSFVGFSTDGKTAVYAVPNDSITLADFVNDDMQSQDAALQEPNESDYQHEVQGWFGITHKETDYEAYWKAEDAYQEKLNRDEIRETLSQPLTDIITDLYYYDGTDKSVLMESVCRYNDVAYNISGVRNDNPNVVYFYSALADLDVSHVKLSECDSIRDCESKISEALESAKMNAECLMALRADTLYMLDLPATDNSFWYSAAGDCLYAAEENSKGEIEELQKIKFSDKGVETTKVESDLGILKNVREIDGKVYYITDYNYEDGEGELHCDGKMIEEDVHYFWKKMDVLLVETDFHSNGYTLSVLKDDKTEKLADDVMDATVTPDGSIYMIMDWNSNKRCGDLYKYGKKKNVLIDEDVTAFAYTSWEE